MIDREKRRIQDLKLSLEISLKELEVFKKYEATREADKSSLEVEKKRAEIDKVKVKHGAELAEKDAAITKAQRKLVSGAAAGDAGPPEAGAVPADLLEQLEKLGISPAPIEGLEQPPPKGSKQ